MSATSHLAQRRFECLVVAALLTFGLTAVPYYCWAIAWTYARGFAQAWGEDNIVGFLALAYGLLLAFTSPRRSGLRIGAIASAWKGVLLVCGGPIVVTLIVYPLLPTKPWGDESFHMWLTVPLTEDALFIGYLFGCFDQLFSKRVWAKVPIPGSLLLTSLFFMVRHIPNLMWLPWDYVLFQLLYTFVGCLITGLSRVWTGSILYATLTHIAVNLIAWLCSPATNAAGL